MNLSSLVIGQTYKIPKNTYVPQPLTYIGNKVDFLNTESNIFIAPYMFLDAEGDLCTFSVSDLSDIEEAIIDSSTKIEQIGYVGYNYGSEITNQIVNATLFKTKESVLAIYSHALKVKRTSELLEE